MNIALATESLQLLFATEQNATWCDLLARRNGDERLLEAATSIAELWIELPADINELSPVEQQAIIDAELEELWSYPWHAMAAQPLLSQHVAVSIDADPDNPETVAFKGTATIGNLLDYHAGSANLHVHTTDDTIVLLTVAEMSRLPL